MQVKVDWIVPEGNSIARALNQYTQVRRNGLRWEIASIILLCLSTNITSIAKRRKKVCIELQGFKIRAWPSLNSFLPKRPFILLKGVLAMTIFLANRAFLVLLIISIAL